MDTSLGIRNETRDSTEGLGSERNRKGNSSIRRPEVRPRYSMGVTTSRPAEESNDHSPIARNLAATEPKPAREFDPEKILEELQHIETSNHPDAYLTIAKTFIKIPYKLEFEGSTRLVPNIKDDIKEATIALLKFIIAKLDEAVELILQGKLMGKAEDRARIIEARNAVIDFLKQLGDKTRYKGQASIKIRLESLVDQNPQNTNAATTLRALNQIT